MLVANGLSFVQLREGRAQIYRKAQAYQSFYESHGTKRNLWVWPRKIHYSQGHRNIDATKGLRLLKNDARSLKIGRKVELGEILRTNKLVKKV